jgi:diguanylate cyclase (GGDEF)-like protein
MMNEKNVSVLKVNPEIVKNYDLLKQIGILDVMLSLEKKNNLSEELLREALVFFNKHTVFDLINYVTQKLLDKFVPLYLAFVIQEEFSPDEARIICFQNMKPIQSIIAVPSLRPYRNYFAQMPAPITYEAFKYVMEDHGLTDAFLPLMPEIIVPMMGLDGLYGFIVFGQKAVGEKYSTEEIAYIDRIMKFASASLQNNIHYTRAIMESKTRLYNHAFFMRKLEEEISRIMRYNSFFSLVLIDIDHFKSINDTYGHLAGDKILSEIAGILEKSVRPSDIAARYGGEEFIILLYKAVIGDAFAIAERIRGAIQNTVFVYENRAVSVTVSLGVTACTSESFADSAELIRQADKALYRVKNDGRNQTVVFSPELDA